MAISKVRLRKLHTALVPLMTLPLVLTLVTGVFFHIAALTGQANESLWLLDLHRGKFGRINLEIVYPFLNALGLLTLIVTGSLMWFQLPRSRVRR